jgi:hypothetical protein
MAPLVPEALRKGELNARGEENIEMLSNTWFVGK